MNEGYIYFGLFGDEFEPDVVTERLGLEPSRIMRKGDPIPKHTSWQLLTEKFVGEVVDVYEIAKPLIERLEPKSEAIRALVDEFDLEAILQVVLWISRDENISTPAIGFDEKMVQFLSKVRGSIDVDTYIT